MARCVEEFLYFNQRLSSISGPPKTIPFAIDQVLALRDHFTCLISHDNVVKRRAYSGVVQSLRQLAGLPV